MVDFFMRNFLAHLSDYRVTFTARFAAGLLIWSSVVVRSEDALAITGTIDSVFPMAQAAGIPQENYKVEFQMRISSCRWRAKWTDSRWKKTDYFEAAYDGEANYQLRSREGFAKQLQQTGTNIGIRFEGKVEGTLIPRDLGSDMITFAWYAFAAKCYLTNVASEGVKESIWQTLDIGELKANAAPHGELLAAKWRFAPSGRFLRSVQFYRGEPARVQNQPTSLAGELTADKTDWVFEGAPFASVLSYVKYSLQNQVQERHTLYVQKVERISMPSETDLRPTVPDATYMTDFRFHKDFPSLSRVTYVTNRWLEPHEVKKNASFARAREAQQEISLGKPKTPKFVVILTASIVVSCGLLLYRLKEKNRNVSNL